MIDALSIYSCWKCFSYINYYNYNPILKMQIVESKDLENIKLPIADICVFNGHVVASMYNRSMKIFKDAQITKEIVLPSTLTKIHAFDNQILLGISFTEGTLTVLNIEFEIVDVIHGFKNAHILSSLGDKVFVGTTDNKMMILQRNGTAYSRTNIDTNIENKHMFDLISIKKSSKVLTAMCPGEKVIALGFESTLALFNLDMKEIFTKELMSCINSICFCGANLIVGTVDGKIHYENVYVFEESFIFNSHFKSQGATKVHFPVTCVYLDNGDMMQDEFLNDDKQPNDELISVGYDGKLAKWDLKNRKLIDSVANFGELFLRKMVVENEKVYCLIENHEIDPNGNILRLIDMKMNKC